MTRRLQDIAEDVRLTGDETLAMAIEIVSDNSELIEALPILDLAGKAYTYIQEGFLPGVAFFPEAIDGATGIFNPQVEIARPIVAKGLPLDAAPLKLIRAAFYITDLLVNGDDRENPDEFRGLKNRIIGPQVITALQPQAGGDPFDPVLLDVTIDQVDGPTHLLMDEDMLELMFDAGYVTENDEGYNVYVDGYQDQYIILCAPIDEESPSILGFNEPAPGGGDAVTTSIYVLNLSKAGVMGFQSGDPAFNEDGELVWNLALGVVSGRAAARYAGIKDAVIVASPQELEDA